MKGDAFKFLNDKGARGSFLKAQEAQRRLCASETDGFDHV